MEVAIPPMGLPGRLVAPERAVGTVVFARCGGEGGPDRLDSPIARFLCEAGLATLYFDLLAPDEAWEQDIVHNIPLLADRVDYAIGFARTRPETAGLPLCLFGTDTGAAAALVSAGSMPSLVWAVVSQAGRPDMAADMLGHVRAPTLFIVDGNDTRTLALNLEAKSLMACETGLSVLPQATPRPQGHGRARQVARLAADWFNLHSGRDRAGVARPTAACPAEDFASGGNPGGREFFACMRKA